MAIFVKKREVSTIRKHALRGAALSVVALAAMMPEAKAQQQATETQEVVVTGSRIKNADVAAANPITVLSTADIEQTKAASIEDIFQHTVGVDFNGGTNTSNNNGGGGASNIGMRNLGPQRTLILIDGQRMIPSLGAAPDLNAIPLSMIDRVEVLRDGASSVYGADAIGGVVNLITKKHADGMTADVFVGTSGHGDGTSYNGSASMAINNERSNIFIGVGHDHTDAIPQSARSWATDMHANDPNFPGSSSYRGQISDALQDENSSTAWINGTAYDITAQCAAIVAKTTGNACLNGVTKLNASNWQTLTSDFTRNQVNASGHYDITDSVTFNASGFYTERLSEQKLRPEPILGDTIANSTFPGFIIPANYPGNTTGGPVTAYWTPSEFGPRDYHQTSDTSRLQASLSGTLFKKYDWELGYVYQSNITTQEVRNEGNFYHLGEMLGQTTCVDIPAALGGCANGAPATPFNFFNVPGNVTPALVNYLTYDNITHTKEHERFAYADVTGDVIDLPAGALKAALGGEIRHEDYTNTPDTLVVEGWAPNQSAPTYGQYNVSSAYGELNIPLLKDLLAVQSLTADISGRFDHYSEFGNAETYKYGLDWAVTQDVRFRSGYSKGFRAPQIGELYGGQGLSDNNASGDPCETNAAIGRANGNFGKGVLTAGSTCSIAVAGGKAVTNFTDPLDQTPNNQQQVLIGGNPGLKPEISHELTVGTVATPRWVPGFSAAVDYYNVRIENTVLIGGVAGVVGVDTILNGCYGPAQNQAYCGFIHRNGSGVITYIDSLDANFGTQKAQGIDFDMSYDVAAEKLMLPVSGAFHLNLLASLQFEDTQTNPDYTTTSFPGTYQPGTANGFNPRWHGVFNIDYNQDNWGLHWDVRYFEHMHIQQADTLNAYGNQAPDMFYNDISATYTFNDLPYVKSLKTTVGIDNLFDKDPPWFNGPSADSTCKCGTIAGFYDEIGRFFYMRLSSKF